jgi:hypothetical protein
MVDIFMSGHPCHCTKKKWGLILMPLTCIVLFYFWACVFNTKLREADWTHSFIHCPRMGRSWQKIYRSRDFFSDKVESIPFFSPPENYANKTLPGNLEMKLKLKFKKRKNWEKIRNDLCGLTPVRILLIFHSIFLIPRPRPDH